MMWIATGPCGVNWTPASYVTPAKSCVVRAWAGATTTKTTTRAESPRTTTRRSTARPRVPEPKLRFAGSLRIRTGTRLPVACHDRRAACSRQSPFHRRQEPSQTGDTRPVPMQRPHVADRHRLEPCRGGHVRQLLRRVGPVPGRIDVALSRTRASTLDGEPDSRGEPVR